MLSEPLKGREKEGRLYTFCTTSFLFPPLRLLSTECAEYAFHGQEALALPGQKIGKKDTKLERREEREIFLLFSYWGIKRWIYYPENLTDFFYFLILEFPEHNHYDQNTWTMHQLSTLSLSRETGGGVRLAKHAGLHFCPASSSTGVNVTQPKVKGMGTLVQLRLEISGFLAKGSQPRETPT